MFIKIYKRIHNRYINIFKFFFFLRYLFIIFIISFSLFVSIPKFFDYEKRLLLIEELLIKNYNLELKDYKSLKFNIFPTPNLNIKSGEFEIKNHSTILNIKNLIIFLPLKNLYKLNDFENKKIVFQNSYVKVEIDHLKNFVYYFNKIKNKATFENLNIALEKNNNNVINIQEINFSNYGFKKYNFSGKIFKKRFSASLKENNTKFKFKMFDTGIEAFFKLKDKSSLIIGNSKFIVLGNKVAFDFHLDENKLEILNSKLRNNNISLSFDSVLDFNPYFDMKTAINIDSINKKIINHVNLKKILEKKEFIQKINNEGQINYNPKKINRNFIKYYNSNFTVSYGRLSFNNETSLSGGKVICKGDSILIEKYPKLNFYCSIKIEDRNIFLKTFRIKNKNEYKNSNLNIDIEGVLNILNRKIDFKNIQIENNYQAKEEDLKFFKKSFEEILFKDDFIKIFNLSNFKIFLERII